MAIDVLNGVSAWGTQRVEVGAGLHWADASPAASVSGELAGYAIDSSSCTRAGPRHRGQWSEDRGAAL